jgi:hypothetical protein
MRTSAGACLLVEAARLVERGWTQGADARGADGAELDPWDGRATSWSILGAIVAVLEAEARECGEVPLEELAAALYALAELVDTDSLQAWNDASERTQREVAAALRRAEAVYESPPPPPS